MAKLVKPDRSPEMWENLFSFAPPGEKLTGKEHERNIRQVIDQWSNKRLSGIKNLGSLIDLKETYKFHIPVVHLKVLYVTRTSKRKTEPYDGSEFEKADPPESFFHLPYDPPREFVDKTEQDMEVIGLRTVRTCDQCKGKGEIRCPKCNGKGTIRCHSCGGAGKVKKTRYQNGRTREYNEQCSTCRGSKTVDCSNCSATGIRECSKCRGYGKVMYRTFVTTRYSPEYLIDVLYRGDFPAKRVAAPDIHGRHVIDSMVMNLEYRMRRERAPWDSNWEKNEETKKYLEYFRNIEEILVHKITKDTKVYNMKADIRIIPVTDVSYGYGKKDYRLFVFGEDNRIHAVSSPSAVAAFLGAAFRKLAGLIRRNKEAPQPEEAILEACTWMCWADGQLHEREHELIFEFIRTSGLPQPVQNRLAKQLKKKPKSFSVGDRIPEKADRERCAKFAWQITISDGDIDPLEESAMEELGSQLGLTSDELMSLKKEAETELFMGE